MILLLIGAVILGLFVGFGIGLSVKMTRTGVTPRPYVAPVTYTVLSATVSHVVDDMKLPPKSRSHRYYLTTVTILSSKGEVKNHEYKAWLTRKQLELVALENNWFYDEESIHFGSGF